MGDVGNPLTSEQMEFMRGVDVLLALTGGPVTIELDDLDAALREIQPKVVIPMHYKIPNLKLNILGLEAFASRYPRDQVEVRSDTMIELTPESLPESMRIVALQPAANR
jgi:L-ascorbate metabolism protein UlaG (beta-lactamase superfamily)